MELWLCGQHQSENGDEVAWLFQGIFNSREKALAACRTRKYFIAPVELNVSLGHEVEQFKGGEYPLWEQTE